MQRENIKVLILTDSVALPRQLPELTYYNDSWPGLLKYSGFDINQCSIGGATSNDLKKQSNYYGSISMDIDAVIIQCGIVDCAPRFLKKYELQLLKNIPIIGRWLIRKLNNNWVRKVRNITYISKTEFKRNVLAIKSKYITKAVFFIGIIPATEMYERELPGVAKKIEEFNKILINNTDLIDVSGIEKYGVMSDFHHLNKMGHKFVFEKILEKIASKN